MCDNHTTDQCLCFRYIDSTMPLLPKSESSRLWSSSGLVQLSMSDLVGNPENRFSHNAVHIQSVKACAQSHQRLYLQKVWIYRLQV